MFDYQIVYTVNSKTHHIELTAPNYSILIDVFNSLIVGEIVEIREKIHEDKTIKKDDKNYIDYSTIKLTNEKYTKINSFKIPKIKKTIDDVQLRTLVTQYIKIDNKIPQKISISTKEST